jgi:hypothetical protein
MTLKAKLSNSASLQKFWIRRAVRRVTCCTALDLKRGVFINERPLFVRVATNTRSICTHREPSLFKFETAMSVVAIAARHRPFKNLVMERLAELCLHL